MKCMTCFYQVHESELVLELTKKRLELENAEKTRVAAAVAESEVRDVSCTCTRLTILN